MKPKSSNIAFLTLIVVVSFNINDANPANSEINYVKSSNYPQHIIPPNNQVTKKVHKKVLLSLEPKIEESLENIPATVIAQQITVRVIGKSAVGSGVIIERKGKIYTVLTCYHVVDNSKDNHFQILTSDGFTHTSKWNRSRQFNDVDLVQLQFISDSDYETAVIGDTSLLKTSDAVYAVGFPNWYWLNPQTVQNTRDWGLKAYQLTTGVVGIMSERSLHSGYQIGITNTISNGMSGGALLNQHGQLVGINGRSKYPLLGTKAFRYQDGTLVPRDMAQEMQAFSWAIPITRIRTLNKE